jgi:cytochrome bd-type quinol oxidase subunit 1
MTADGIKAAKSIKCDFALSYHFSFSSLAIQLPRMIAISEVNSLATRNVQKLTRIKAAKW